MLAARRKELDWVHDTSLYKSNAIQQASLKHIKPTIFRWGGVNNDDDGNMNVRSRVVGREPKANTKDAFLAHDVLSAMPPWDKILFLIVAIIY